MCFTKNTIIISTLFFCSLAQAVSFTKGFYLPSENEYDIWGFGDGFGSSVEQNSASSNPDLFCKTRGDGYRLPTLEEMSHQLSPIDGLINISQGRGIGKSLYGEWGYIASYPASGWATPTSFPEDQLGWTSKSYWVQGTYENNPDRRKAYITDMNSEYIDRTCTTVSGKKVCEYNSPGLSVQKFANVACIKNI